MADQAAPAPGGTDGEQPLPPGFGIARVVETGTATHELIYEHEYFPKPIRKFHPDEPLGSLLIRPAVRKGKVPFRFWGNRVPLSADHARCWLGQVLLAEVAQGKLALVELILSTEEDLLRLSTEEAGAGSGGIQKRHGPQPTWLWHVWTLGSNVGVQRRSPPIELHLRMTANNGIIIELHGEEEGALASLYRILHQYCDDDEGDTHWRPIPDEPGKISKVCERECAHDVRRRRLLGLPSPETGGNMLSRSLNQWREAETCLLQAMDRTQATYESAPFSVAIPCFAELRDAVLKADRARLRKRPEWCEAITFQMEGLLRRMLEATAIGTAESTDSQLLGDAVRIMVDITGLSIRAPECLETAQLQLQSSLGSATIEGSTAVTA